MSAGGVHHVSPGPSHNARGRGHWQLGVLGGRANESPAEDGLAGADVTVEAVAVTGLELRGEVRREDTHVGLGRGCMHAGGVKSTILDLPADLKRTINQAGGSINQG